MIDIRKIVELINDPDRLPSDDYALVSHEIVYLNRIDQEWGCDEIVDMDRNFPYGNLEPSYCGLPEHDPFTNCCWDHTPGNLSSGHM